MAMSQAARSRRLAQKAARRKAVVAEKRKADALWGSVASDVARAVVHPVECCLVTDALFLIGIGYVIFARRSPSGNVKAAFFLVDTSERGVKDVYFDELSSSDFDDRVDMMAEANALVDWAPGRARLLLQSAVKFARRRGIAPHKDYRALEAFFGDIQVEGDPNEFEFGPRLDYFIDDEGDDADKDTDTGKE